MPHRRLPNTISSVIRTLKAARDKYKTTPVVTERALSTEQWAKLDDANPNSLLSKLLKEANDVDLALAAQAPLTNAFNLAMARLTMYCSHFHQVLDLGITRGTFAPGARSYYGRDIGATALPDLSTHIAVLEVAEKIVNGEAARAAAESGGTWDGGQTWDSGTMWDGTHVAMALPSAAQVGTLRTEVLTDHNEAQQALENTDTEREEAQALYAEAQALAVDICDTVEFFYRKDPDASSRRTKCERWGVVYIFDPGEVPPTPPAPTPPPTP
ncbi:MAG: hypothetical protein HY301_06375 [Verrucomicrobia bacterium]|nr:hypothetical protein [Verrucomicrobiota bacterium]